MAETSPRTINWYIDRAMIRSGAPSERVLGEQVGLAPNSLSNYRTGRAFPSDQIMERLAELADADPDMALIDLNIWRAKTDTVRDRYTRLARMLEKASAAVIVAVGIVGLLAAPTGTHAEQNDAPAAYSVHYGK